MGKHISIFRQIQNFFTGQDAAEHWLYMLIWCSGLVAVVRSVVIRFTGSIALSYVAYYAIFFIAIVGAYRKYLAPKLRISDLAFVFSAFFVFISTYVLFPQNEVILNDWFPTFIVSALPMFFVGICLDIERFKKPLFFASIVCLIWMAFYNLYYLQNTAVLAEEEDTTHYRMDFAYGLLPYLLVIAWETMSDLKIWKIPILLFAFVLLIMLGTRGPLIFAVLFVILYTLFFTGGKFYVKLLVVVSGILIYFNFFDISLLLFDQTESLNMSTRITSQILGYEDMNNSREGMANIFFKDMSSSDFNLFIGAGIGGSFSRLKIAYAHNLYIDMIYSFGIVLGNIVFWSVVVLMVKAYRRAKSSVWREFLLVMFILGFAVLFLSDTFVKNPWFYMLIGVCVGIIRRRKIVLRV